MTLNRILLRFAAQAALTNFGREPFPTLAGNNVFDSKIEPDDSMEGERPRPIAVLYTDYDRNFVHHGSQPKSDRLLTLTIELLMVKAEELFELDDDGRPVTPNPIGYELLSAVTDSEMETSLDLFEGQVFSALFGATSAADCFKALVPKIEDTISRRGASLDGGQKLSARQITIEAVVPRDPRPGKISSEAERFLLELQDFEPYEGRAIAMREAFVAGASVSAAQKLISALGVPDRMGSSLGLEKPYVVQPIEWLDPLRGFTR